MLLPLGHPRPRRRYLVEVAIMTFDTWLDSTSPLFGLGWAHVLAYLFIAGILIFLGWLATKLDRKTILYWIVGIVGVILFFQRVLGWNLPAVILGGGS